MNDIDPAWLRSLLAIAQHGSVTRAAAHVHRTQSAVSTQLQQLEASLGTQLVQRSTRSLRLTADGERFLLHARRILELQDEARASDVPFITAYTSLACLPLMVPASTSARSSATCLGETGKVASRPAVVRGAGPGAERVEQFLVIVERVLLVVGKQGEEVGRHHAGGLLDLGKAVGGG